VVVFVDDDFEGWVVLGKPADQSTLPESIHPRAARWFASRAAG
jgi:hypothetical protein